MEKIRPIALLLNDLIYILLRGSILLLGVFLIFFIPFPFKLITPIFLILYGILYSLSVKKWLNKLNVSIEAKAAADTCSELFIGPNLSYYLKTLKKMEEKAWKSSVLKFTVYTIFFWSLLVFLIVTYLAYL